MDKIAIVSYQRQDYFSLTVSIELTSGQSQKMNGLITGFEMKSLGVLEVIQQSSCIAQNQLQWQIIHKQP